VKNRNCYVIKIVHQYSVIIWILTKISLHENVGRDGTDLQFQRMHKLHIPCCFIFFIAF